MEAISDDALFRDKLKHMGKCECPVSVTFPPARRLQTLMIVFITLPFELGSSQPSC